MSADPFMAGSGDLVSLATGAVLWLFGGPQNSIPVAAMLVAGFLL